MRIEKEAKRKFQGKDECVATQDSTTLSISTTVQLNTCNEYLYTMVMRFSVY